MWVINPEGLPDSGKVAAVISSAFGSFSEARKKKKKNEEREEGGEERQTAVRQYRSVKKRLQQMGNTG